MWCAGAHADVGGGYGASVRGLVDVALRWIVNRVADTCRLEVDLRPLVLPGGDACQFAVHDSTTWLYRVGSRLRLTKRYGRTVDGGLCADGSRDAERVITEALHANVEKFAGANAGYAPDNVRDYLARCGAPRGRSERRRFAPSRSSSSTVRPSGSTTGTAHRGPAPRLSSG